MSRLKTSWNVFFIYSSFIALVAIFILSGMVLSPSEPGNALFLGLSLPRLILVLGLLVAFILFALISVKSFQDRAWAEGTLEQWFGGSRISKAITWIAGIGLGLGWIGCFLPFYRAGILAVHWGRLRPAMVFILLASAATLMTIFVKT